MNIDKEMHNLHIAGTSPPSFAPIVPIAANCVFVLFQKRALKLGTWFVGEEDLLTFTLSNCLIYWGVLFSSFIEIELVYNTV